MQPGYINLFENITTVQFDHRLLATATFVAVVAFWICIRRTGVQGTLLRAVNLMAFMVCLQVALGISTLLLVVPVPLAAAHQAGAVVLLGLSVWTLREAASGRK